jgi:hypothetical protein
MPVYVKNDTNGILGGIKTAFDEHDKRTSEIMRFGEKYGVCLEKEIEDVKALLGLEH